MLTRGCGNIIDVYRLDEIVRHVRSRLPFGPPVNDHGSPLPFVPRAPSVKPILPVADMDAAIDFYRGLAFEVNAYDDGYAWVKHCSWEYLHLRRVDGLDPAVNEASAYIHVADAAQWHAALVAQSSNDVVGELVDEPWGMREFSIVDPAGNLLRFGHHL